MTTLKHDVKFTGVGIHSGAPVNMIVHPSHDAGIFFVRTDMPGTGPIAATWDNVCDTRMRNTTIGDLNGAHVKTIEHVMAALFLAGITDAIIEIDGPETPILDGSAMQFYTALADAAPARRGKMPRIVVRKKVRVSARDAWRQLPFWARVWTRIRYGVSDGYVTLHPAKDTHLHVRATLNYAKDAIIGLQTYGYTFDGTRASVTEFVRDIAPARTFGKYSEWEKLKKHGMARGADEHNVIAVSADGKSTLNATLWPDEFVRHKIIDAVGDMFTSGGFLVADIDSYKGSHMLNNMVLKKLFSNPENYDIINANE